MKMVAGKLGRMVAAIFIVSFLTFALAKALPGDPALIVLGTSSGTMIPCATNPGPSTANDTTVADCRGIPHSKLHPRGAVGPAPLVQKCEAVRCVLARDQFLHQHHLDLPIIRQYAQWVGGALHGDFGTTYDAAPERVSHQIAQALPATIELMILAELVALLFAIPLGVYSAYRENKLGDKVATGFSFLALAIPNFVLAIFLVLFFVVALGWLPLLYTPWSQDPVKNVKSIIIPVIALAAGTIAVFARLLRSDMIATLQEDFILMARAKGLPPMQVLFRHALRPSSFSLLTVAGINLGALIGGTVIIESMFVVNGLGYLLIAAIEARNFPVIQAVVLLITAVFVIINVLVDIIYSLLDPRIRHA